MAAMLSYGKEAEVEIFCLHQHCRDDVTLKLRIQTQDFMEIKNPNQ
jgi:hypothetical protein